MSKLFQLGQNKSKRNFFAEIPLENRHEVDDVSGGPKFLLRATDLSSRKVNFALEAISLALERQTDKTTFITDLMHRKFGGRWICILARAPVQINAHSEKAMVVEVDDFLINIIKL